MAELEPELLAPSPVLTSSLTRCTPRTLTTHRAEQGEPGKLGCRAFYINSWRKMIYFESMSWCQDLLRFFWNDLRETFWSCTEELRITRLASKAIPGSQSLETPETINHLGHRTRECQSLWNWKDSSMGVHPRRKRAIAGGQVWSTICCPLYCQALIPVSQPMWDMWDFLLVTNEKMRLRLNYFVSSCS